MRAVAAVVATLALAVLVGACVNAPLPVTPEPGAPCGIAYVTCTENGKQTGFCCDENTACCNGSLCPAGECEPTWGEQGARGKVARTKQFRAGSR
jgi:hypothetical protein